VLLPTDASLFLIAFGITAVLGAILTVSQRHPIASAMALLMSLLSLAGMYAYLGGHFLAWIQIIVYAGAIIVLMIYTIMLMDLRDSDLDEEPSVSRWLAAGIGLTAGLSLAQQITGGAHNLAIATVVEPFGTTKAVGAEMFTRYLIPFEMASVLLLAGIVGALHLAKVPTEKDL
jgi:NADH-quinone oxidoreductase subunit J